MAQADPMLIRLRADTMVVREVGILHFHEPLNNEPNSILFANDDIDRISTDTSYR